MKELSIEEKAKRYDDLLVKLQEAKVDYDVCDERYCCVIDNIVPELKESEGERIREALVEMVHDTTGDSLWIDYNVHKEDALSWLEKQGERKSLDDIAKEVIKDKDAAISFLKSTGIMNENGELADEYKIEQVEQKPAWSEEDEQTFIKSVEALEDFGKFELADWLKEHKNQFLKPQNTWKPSKEQMNTLEYYMQTLVCNEYKEILFGLYEDLKKLMEE